MSTTNPSGKRLSNSPLNRNHVLAKTRELLLQGPQDGEDCIVQPPPTVHPEKIIPKLVAAHDLSVVFIAPTKAQLTRMEQRCSNHNLSTHRITSPYNSCGSYTGKHGDSVETRVKSHIDRGATLGDLHRNGNLPCQPGCSFAGRNHPAYNEQVILANPHHAYIDGVLEDRVVFTCSLRGDAYVTKLENPSKALDAYLDKNTQFVGYNDFIQNRDSGRSPSIWDYENGIIDPATPDEEFGYAIDKDGHHFAPQAVFGLLHAEELDNGWETSFGQKKDVYGNHRPTNRPPVGGDPFDIGGVDYYRTRVVRQPGETPEEDTIYVLDVPNFTKANSVVAFDIAPTPWMWRLYYGTNFNHQSVYSDGETAEFLRSAMGVKVVQTATSRKPYEGNNVTPGRDASIAVWATAEFGKPPIVVSTKNALGRYRSKQSALLNADAKNGIQYRRGGSVITDKSPLIILNGSPRPRNEEFQLWGALAGKSVRNPNQNQSFGETGDEIRRQFCESRVGKWATRFNCRNATVVLNTTAVPEWLQRSSVEVST